MSMTTIKPPSPPSVAESATTARQSSTSGRPTPASTVRTVVTSPPWAKDEPESPLFDTSPYGPERSPRPSGISTTHVPSIISERPSTSAETVSGHHRWNFALPRPRPKLKRHRSSDSSSSQSVKGSSIRERRLQPGPSRPPRPRWPNSRKRISPELSQNPQTPTSASSPSRTSRSETLRLELPLAQPKAPFTLSHNKTPGWDSPWTPRIPQQAFTSSRGLEIDTEMDASQGWANGNDAARAKEAENLEQGSLRPWPRRRKDFRSFVLHNTYVPLVSRLVNLTFTTVALALAIRIRLIEEHEHLRGAVGSSPVLTIIFAPLTLVHVMVAIYLEYFGRPLGLWRTSAKLAHTLSEVVFICAWSAELALCFDNYFTSPLGCAPHSAVAWYSELPPVTNPLGKHVTGDLEEDAHTLCDYQLDLVGVVMVALLLYVTNLVISLYRIFEKVKVHQGWGYAR